MRKVFISLADFDIRWGVYARETEKIFFRRFRSQIIFKYTPAVRSNICRGLFYAWWWMWDSNPRPPKPIKPMVLPTTPIVKDLVGYQSVWPLAKG